MALFLVAIALFAALVAIVIFGDSPAVRHTSLHRLHTSLVALSSRLSRLLAANRSLYAVIQWIVPVFYITVVAVCLAVFFAHVYPQLPQRLSHLHAVAIAAVISSVVLSTCLVTFTLPGYVNEYNVARAQQVFPENGLIFFKKSCSTCMVPKPARSKHCSQCGHCVLLYDHHCVWVNNCIGLHNYRWFLLYLAANVALMVYGAYLCGLLLALNKTPDRGWWRLIVATTPANKSAGVLWILAVSFSLVTAAFTALHVWYIYLGVTTNEADKWGEIEHLVHLGVLFYARDSGQYLEQVSVGLGGFAYVSLGDERVVVPAGDLRERFLVKIELVRTDLVNCYDRGFLQNLRERMLGS